jgi:hypothetical protein
VDTVKVSTEIPKHQHMKLGRLALKHETTIGNIVAFSVRRTLKELASDPTLADGIEPDRRRAPANGGNKS